MNTTEYIKAFVYICVSLQYFGRLIVQRCRSLSNKRQNRTTLASMEEKKCSSYIHLLGKLQKGAVIQQRKGHHSDQNKSCRLSSLNAAICHLLLFTVSLLFSLMCCVKILCDSGIILNMTKSQRWIFEVIRNISLVEEIW